jgi:hypothetical protein
MAVSPRPAGSPCSTWRPAQPLGLSLPFPPSGPQFLERRLSPRSLWGIFVSLMSTTMVCLVEPSQARAHVTALSQSRTTTATSSPLGLSFPLKQGRLVGAAVFTLIILINDCLSAFNSHFCSEGTGHGAVSAVCSEWLQFVSRFSALCFPVRLVDGHPWGRRWVLQIPWASGPCCGQLHPAFCLESGWLLQMGPVGLQGRRWSLPSVTVLGQEHWLLGLLTCRFCFLLHFCAVG